MPISGLGSIEKTPSPEVPISTPETEGQVSPETSPREVVETTTIEHGEPALPTTPVVSDESSVADNFQIDEKFKNIESILEEDLGEIYFSLDEQKQQEFKVKGEETTLKILTLLNKPKIQVKKIVYLIRDWLKIIPGINKFFLEQSAKIKAEKIITKNR